MSDLTLKPKFRKLRAKLGLHASWSEIFYVHRKETENLRQPESCEKYRVQDDGSLNEPQIVTTKRWHSTFDTNQISNPAVYANPGYDSLADWDKSSISDCGTLSKSSASDYGTLSSTSSREKYKPSPYPRPKPGISEEKIEHETNSDYASWDSSGMKDSDGSDDCLNASGSQADDGLNDFCDYFERRKNAVQKWIPNVPDGKATPVEEKMIHLRTQIASLVAQDDTLFKQLLTLHSAINDLKVQSQPVGFSTPSSSESEADESEASDYSEEHIYNEIDAPARRRRYLQHSETVREVRATVLLSEGQSVRRPQSFPRRHRDKRQPPESQTSERVIVLSQDCIQSLRAPLVRQQATRTESHRRQYSFDSGFQGSEQSDAEVFV